eukprot:CAMPEP_0116013432 /NCGR_PEP_ID=MMETSP0321-20121206/5723_1 /TAXON_ID=163516 /ORGANISM="Leptocylindrus danicus var. danicus, Strain B650" /LENGTH=469 /DNA_ID=CAMNT_0003482981 /DNA_START=357 /DNA_END=1766 /DNA_ORIENTATION=+
MLTGRFIYGLAGDNIAIAKSALMALWFDGTEMSFAFSIALTIGRIGGVIGNFVSPWYANRYGVPDTFWLATFVNLFGTVMSIFVYWIDRKATIKYGYNDGIESVATATLKSPNGSVASSSSNSNQVNNGGNNGGDDADSAASASSSVSTGFKSTASSQRSPRIHYEDDYNDDPYETNKMQVSITKRQSKSNNQEYATVQRRVKQKFRPSDIKKFDLLFWLLCICFTVVSSCVIPFNTIASGLLLERDLFTSTPSECQIAHPNQCSAGNLAPEDGNPATDVNTGKACPSSDYVAPAIPTSINITGGEALAMSAKYGWDETEYVFQNLTMSDVRCTDEFWKDSCTSNFCNSQETATERAGAQMSIPYLISALCAIPVGKFVDAFGKRGHIAAIGISCLVVVHVLLAHSTVSAAYLLIGQGLAYSAYGGVLWPSIPLIVDPALLGTAYGVMLSIQNAALTLVSPRTFREPAN